MELAQRICQSLTETHVQEHYSTVVHSLYSRHMGNIFVGCKARSLLEREQHCELMRCLMLRSTVLSTCTGKPTPAEPTGSPYLQTSDLHPLLVGWDISTDEPCPALPRSLPRSLHLAHMHLVSPDQDMSRDWTLNNTQQIRKSEKEEYQSLCPKPISQ